MLVVATLLSLLDSVAAQVDVVADAFGDGTQPGTVAFAATSNRDVLAAIADATVQATLTPVFARRAALMHATVHYPSLQGAMMNRALDEHYGAALSNLNMVLRANDARVHPNLNLIGFQIDARNLFYPVTLDPVAAYEGTGAGTGTFVAGSNILPSEFGPSAMEVVVDVMGASLRTLRLTMLKWDESTENKDVAVPANSLEGATVAIGAAGDRYLGVSGITTIGGGGTALDRLRVRSKVERAIAL